MSRDGLFGLVVALALAAICGLIHALRLLNRWLASGEALNPVARNARARGRIRLRRDGTLVAEPPITVQAERDRTVRQHGVPRRRIHGDQWGAPITWDYPDQGAGI